MANEVFISYSRSDLERVRAIKQEIDRSVGINCWMDLDGIESGDEFMRVIISAIKRHRTVLFMLSENSVKSEWALDELDFAKKEGKRIVLVDLDHTKMPDDFWFRYHKYDTIDWQSAPQHDKLIRNLQKWFGQPKASQTSPDLPKVEKSAAQSSPATVPSLSRKRFYIGFGGIAIVIVLVLLFAFLKSKRADVPPEVYIDSLAPDSINEEKAAIDSTKYYWGSFDEKNLFIKGLKRGALYDSSCQASFDSLYTYKCGFCNKISGGYICQMAKEVIFYTTDEDNITLPLDTDFGEIGYDTSLGDTNFIDIYPNNQYILGQCDLDNDNVDELIVAVRTVGDEIPFDAAGIGINVFKRDNGTWKRQAELNVTTNVLPANAKIVKNSIYIYWLRYDEKYTFTGDAFVEDPDFEGRAFTSSDFD